MGQRIPRVIHSLLLTNFEHLIVEYLRYPHTESRIPNYFTAPAVIPWMSCREKTR
jgi:hypothetical protein